MRNCFKENNSYVFPLQIQCNAVCWLASLTHGGLIMPYAIRDLGQNWFRQWFAAWLHQTITSNNVDCHQRDLAFIAGKCKILIPQLYLKFTHSESQPHLQETNESRKTQTCFHYIVNVMPANDLVLHLGPVLLMFLRHVARISANGIAAFKESCTAIGKIFCDMSQ